MRFRAAVLIFVFALLMCSGLASAKVGVGVILGEPTGFSFKRWFNDETAFDLASGWSLAHGDFYLHGDYLWHRVVFDETVGGSAPLYFGVGARILLRDDEDSEIGVRIPVGLDFPLGDGRFDVFVEIAPMLNVVPDTEFDLSGGVGARFYF